ncbi:MAG: hypothetical protein EKK55_07715 [Rhodocyclaceae bacterium]|nr:MAG: hypothetical protein EKK55_07715 [Rhodocyclaceae bacterium]
MEAVLVERRPFQAHHLIAVFFTPVHGLVPTIAFGGQRSRVRFPDLDFFHTYEVAVELDRDLPTLLRAAVVKPRSFDVRRHMVAARAVTLIEKTAARFEPEPGMWTALIAFLDKLGALDAEEQQAEVAALGLTLLRLAGWCPPASALRPGMSPRDVLAVVDGTLAFYA